MDKVLAQMDKDKDKLHGAVPFRNMLVCDHPE
jgi:hypothetical protein